MRLKKFLSPVFPLFSRHDSRRALLALGGRFLLLVLLSAAILLLLPSAAAAYATCSGSILYVDNDFVDVRIGLGASFNDQYTSTLILYRDGVEIYRKTFTSGCDNTWSCHWEVFTDTGLAKGQTYLYSGKLLWTTADASGEEECFGWGGNYYLGAIAGDVWGTITRDITWSGDTWTLSRYATYVDIGSGVTLTITGGAVVQSADSADPTAIRLIGNSAMMIDGATLKNITISQYPADPVTLSIKNSTLEDVSGTVGTLSAFESNSGSCTKITSYNTTGLDAFNYFGNNLPGCKLFFELEKAPSTLTIKNNTFEQIWISRNYSSPHLSSSVTVSDNTFSFLTLKGVSGPVNIENNTGQNISISDNVPPSQSKNSGALTGIIKQFIKSNTLNNPHDAGIMVDNGASSLRVEGNSITCSEPYTAGIAVYGTNTEVVNNTTSNCSGGVTASGSNNIVQRNDIDCNNVASPYPDHGGGIGLLYASSNQIINNKIANCDRGLNISGYYYMPTSNNIVKDNVLDGNVTGIYLKRFAKDNQIYNNIFGTFTGTGNIDAQNLDCTSGAKDERFYAGVLPTPCPNTWNQAKTAGENIVGGPYVGGNYWRDYTGVDADGDGIGDTPYTINDDNIDNLPLMYDNVVNSTGDDADQYIGDGFCDTGNTITRNGQSEPECTLRAAIQESNSSSDLDTLAFDIQGAAVPTVSPDSQLPSVTAPLIIDATSQPSFGKINLNGTNAGEADGLVFGVDSGTSRVKGLTVQNFKKNGISAANQLIELVDVEIIDNCGWGVYAQNGIDINVISGTTVSSGINKFNGNGTGQGCAGGGIWSYNRGVSAHNLEVTNNGGPGILAEYKISLLSVQSNNNKGPGIQSFNSSVIIGHIEGGILSQVIGNKGQGIWASENAEQESCEEEEGCEGVEIDTTIEVRDNGGWGIYARGGVGINVAASRVSKVNNNGKGTECWVIDDRDDDLEQEPCEGGGIWSYDSGIGALNLEVKLNGGPGILAADKISLLSVQSNNNKGPGIQSFNSSVIIGHKKGGILSQVIGNKGHGIWALENREQESCGEGEGCEGVEIDTPIEVRDNGGWGIYARGGVGINVAASRVSKVNNNGKGTECWVIDDRDDDLEQEPCEGGGIWSYNSGIGALNLEVKLNGGPGILAADKISLLSVQSNNNKGPGIQSFHSSVVIGYLYLPLVGIANQVIGNKGHGIRAYKNAERVNCEVHDVCDGVVIKSSIEISNNGGWGIYAEGNVVVNQLRGRTVSFQVSKINSNNRGVECWAMDDRESDLMLGNCGGGGILSNDGFVSARVFEVSDNGGPGVEASDDLFLFAGKVCRNLGRGIDAGGSLTLRQVTVCGNQSSGVHLSAGATGKQPSDGSVLNATASPTSYIAGSMIVDNGGDGILFVGGDPLIIISSNIYGNTGSGINNQDVNVSIDARNNWWGDAGGPGSDVNGNVDYSNWQTAFVALSVAAGSDITEVRGADADARFFLTNFTDSEETYDIAISDTLSWGLALTSQTVTVGAGQSGEIVVAVSIPVSASNGAEDEVTLTATATTDPSVAGSAAVKVTARTMLINEVHPGEGWVELYNPGPGGLLLSGWRLIDGDGELDIAIPEQDIDWDGLLEEGAYLVIHLLAGDTADTPSEDIYAGVGAVLNGTGDSLALLNPHGVGIDFMMYGDSQDIPPGGTGWTGTNTGAPQAAQSLGRDQYGSDSDSATDWENTCGADADSPTPGRRNLPSALISVNPVSYRFGDVVREGSSTARSFVVASTGEQSLQIGALSLSGRDASHFSIGNDSCAGQMLAVSATCTFEIVLSPALDGLHIANLLIPSNDPVDPLLLVPLRGNGRCVAGDVNNDRLSNILDVILAMRISLGHPPVHGSICPGDVDENGAVNILDAIRMMLSLWSG